MRRICRILRLLRNKGWIKLIRTRDVTRVDVLRGLTVGLLYTNMESESQFIITASENQVGMEMEMGIGIGMGTGNEMGKMYR